MEDEEELKSKIVYVGNLPKELTEKQLKGYFSQFGRVVKIRLMKSKKTNNSRGYCYIKFETPKIASIAAEAMNNYFIDGRVLKCHVKEHNPNVKNLFNKGPPIPSHKARLASHAIHMDEEISTLEEKMQAIMEALEKNEAIVADEATERLRLHLLDAIGKMENKQELLETDIYQDRIGVYKQALKLFPKLAE